MTTRSLRLPLLIALLPLAAACSRPEAPVHKDIRPVRSIVVGASNGSVGATYSGEVLARYESRLGFQISGRIASRLVEVGSQVKRGQPLMQLAAEQETLHVVSASADVDTAQSRVTQSRIDLARTERLFSQGFVSQAKLDDQRLALTQTEMQLKSALAQQQIRQIQRGYGTLVADRDGVVTAIAAEAGQVVSAGQQVVTVAADGEREVLVSIPESRVDELRQAKSLQISFWAQPGKTFHGSVRELAPGVDSVTRTYAARITILGADGTLRLGMTASVHAADIEGSTAIRLPLTAIYNKDGQALVWVVDEKTSKVATRAVKLGAAHNDSVLVAQGLSGGEQVVTAGVNMLHQGQKVLRIEAPELSPVAQR